MEKQIININDEQRSNLVNEIATLIGRFKKNKDVECIYFAPYKGLGKINGYVLELIVVTRENSEEMNKEFYEYNKLHQEHESIRKFGMKIYVMFDNIRKYTKLPLNPSEVIRANNLFNSVILYDKTDEYSKIKQEAQEYADIPNSNVFEYENSAEIYQPIEELIKMELETQDVKEFTKTKTFEFIKNML